MQWHMMPSIVVMYRVDNSEIEYNIKHAHIDTRNGEIHDAFHLENIDEKDREFIVKIDENMAEKLRQKRKDSDTMFDEIDKKIGSRCLTIFADNTLEDIVRQLTTILQNSHYYE